MKEWFSKTRNKIIVAIVAGAIAAASHGLIPKAALEAVLVPTIEAIWPSEQPAKAPQGDDLSLDL